MAVSGDDVVVANVVANTKANLVSRSARVGEHSRTKLANVILSRVTDNTTATDAFDDVDAAFTAALAANPIGLHTKEALQDAFDAAMASEPDATP